MRFASCGLLGLKAPVNLRLDWRGEGVGTTLVASGFNRSSD